VRFVAIALVIAPACALHQPFLKILVTLAMVMCFIAANNAAKLPAGLASWCFVLKWVYSNHAARVTCGENNSPQTLNQRFKN
jgi:hypothetical protein